MIVMYKCSEVYPLQLNVIYQFMTECESNRDHFYLSMFLFSSFFSVSLKVSLEKTVFVIVSPWIKIFMIIRKEVSTNINASLIKHHIQATSIANLKFLKH